MEELEVCPVCHEDCAYIETEGDWCLYAMCASCGTHTAFAPYSDEKEKELAIASTVKLWNMGKVIAERRGE